MGMSESALRTALRKGLHKHFCKNNSCRRIYQCYHCDDPFMNGRCDRCRGMSRPIWIAQFDAHDCCVDNCKQVTTNEERKSAMLAGPGPWYRCRTCKRAHGWPHGLNPETGEPKYVVVPRTTPRPRVLGSETTPIGGNHE